VNGGQNMETQPPERGTADGMGPPAVLDQPIEDQ
jgi:hypothetical protein